MQRGASSVQPDARAFGSLIVFNFKNNAGGTDLDDSNAVLQEVALLKDLGVDDGGGTRFVAEYGADMFRLEYCDLSCSRFLRSARSS